MERKLIGHYIVVDPQIAAGQPTFRGTRVMVWQVLDLVAKGMDWEMIGRHWPGHISQEAIAEAVSLASQVFADHAQEYRWELEPSEEEATSFLRTTRSLNLAGPPDWSASLEAYLYGPGLDGSSRHPAAG